MERKKSWKKNIIKDFDISGPPLLHIVKCEYVFSKIVLGKQIRTYSGKKLRND